MGIILIFKYNNGFINTQGLKLDILYTLVEITLDPFQCYCTYFIIFLIICENVAYNRLRMSAFVQRVHKFTCTPP